MRVKVGYTSACIRMQKCKINLLFGKQWVKKRNVNTQFPKNILMMKSGLIKLEPHDQF